MLIDQKTANQMMASDDVNPMVEYPKGEIEKKFHPTASKVWNEFKEEYPNLFLQIRPFVNTYCYSNAYTLDALEDDVIQAYLGAGLNIYSFPRREYLNLSNFFYKCKNVMLEANRQQFDANILSDLEPLREDFWEYLLKYQSDMKGLCRQMLQFAQLYEKTQEIIFRYYALEQQMNDNGIDQNIVMDELNGKLYEYLSAVYQ